MHSAIECSGSGIGNLFRHPEYPLSRHESETFPGIGARLPEGDDSPAIDHACIKAIWRLCRLWSLATWAQPCRRSIAARTGHFDRQDLVL
jgi:hypothetical protein